MSLKKVQWAFPLRAKKSEKPMDVDAKGMHAATNIAAAQKWERNAAAAVSARNARTTASSDWSDVILKTFGKTVGLIRRLKEAYYDLLFSSLINSVILKNSGFVMLYYLIEIFVY